MVQRFSQLSPGQEALWHSSRHSAGDVPAHSISGSIGNKKRQGVTRHVLSL